MGSTCQFNTNGWLIAVVVVVVVVAAAKPRAKQWRQRRSEQPGPLQQ
jgi:hypothetical protein